MRQSQRRSAPAPRRPRAGPIPHGQPLAGPPGILALQHAIGNRSTARLLARAAPAPGDTPRRAQRRLNLDLWQLKNPNTSQTVDVDYASQTYRLPIQTDVTVDLKGGIKSAAALQTIINADPVPKDRKRYELNLGEGDFDAALKMARGNEETFFTVTEYAPLEYVASHHGYRAVENIVELSKLSNAVIRFGFDATQLGAKQTPMGEFKSYDKVTFLNPHTDVYGPESTESQRKLMASFFDTVGNVTKVDLKGSTAEILISVTGRPFVDISSKGDAAIDKAEVNLIKLAEAQGWQKKGEPQLGVPPSTVVTGLKVKKTTGGTVKSGEKGQEIKLINVFNFEKPPAKPPVEPASANKASKEEITDLKVSMVKTIKPAKAPPEAEAKSPEEQAQAQTAHLAGAYKGKPYEAIVKSATFLLKNPDKAEANLNAKAFGKEGYKLVLKDGAFAVQSPG